MFFVRTSNFVVKIKSKFKKTNHLLLTSWLYLEVIINLFNIASIDTQFQNLTTVIGRDNIVQSQFIKVNNNLLFNEAWNFVGRKFDWLGIFLESLATAFPRTSNAENDFSVVKWGKNPHYLSLTDFSLERILHAK